MGMESGRGKEEEGEGSGVPPWVVRRVSEIKISGEFTTLVPSGAAVFLSLLRRRFLWRGIASWSICVGWSILCGYFSLALRSLHPEQRVVDFPIRCGFIYFFPHYF